MDQQAIARRALGKVSRALNDYRNHPDPYVSGSDRRYLGESDHGTIMAPRAGAADYWEAFDIRKPGHARAWLRTWRDGRIAFLDLETVDR